jgi:membrane fusion protein, hemolysin D
MSDQESESVTKSDVEQLERFAQQKLEGTKLSEVLTAVPPLLLRGVIYMTAGAVVLTFILLYFGKVYAVVTATGKIVPEGESILIQSLDSGVVREVAVKTGDRVVAGAPLVKLDVTRSGLNVASLTRKQQVLTEDVRSLRGSEAEVNRLMVNPDAWLHGTEPRALAPVIAGAIHDLKRAWLAVDEARKTDRVGFPEKKTQMVNEIALAQQKIQLLQKDLKQTGEEIAAEEESLGRKRTKLEEFRRLALDRGLYSRIEVEEEEERFRLASQTVADRRKARDQKELELSNERLNIADMEMKVRSEELTTGKQFQLAVIAYGDALNALRSATETLKQSASQKEADLANTTEELHLARGQMAFSSIASPVAGTVTELKVRNSGEVVSAGQAIAVIVPEGVPLVVDAQVPNRDVGFVRVGSLARIKVDAFPFQRFGTLEGRVLKVFPNAGEGDKFSVKIGIDSPHLKVGDERVTMFPGLAVQADVLTSRQRLLSLLLRKGSG